MKFKATVKIQMNPTAKTIENLGLGESGDVQTFHTANVLRRIQRYMPFLTGEMIENTIANTDINNPEIVTKAPQALKLYHGISGSGKPINYTTTKNPQAGPYWDRALVANEMPAMIRELQSYIDNRKRKGAAQSGPR